MNRYNNLQKGFTLIELSVAIIITSIVVAMVYSSWTYWNRYIARTQSKTEMRTEAHKIMKKINTDLRKAKTILFQDRNRIGFVKENSGDTIVYSYDYDGVIKQNNIEIKLLPKGCEVKNFSIENKVTTEENDIYLLSISLTLKNLFNDTINTESCIMLKLSGNERNSLWRY